MRAYFFKGPLHWEPAELGSQQTVGRSGGLPARLCQHANEAVAGKRKLKHLVWIKQYIVLRVCGHFSKNPILTNFMESIGILWNITRAKHCKGCAKHITEWL